MSFCLERFDVRTKQREMGVLTTPRRLFLSERVLQMKTAFNRSFLTDKLEKVAIQPTVNSASMNPPSTQRGALPLLAQVELHPILCPNATTATCTYTTSLAPKPNTRQAVGIGFGGVAKLPSHLEYFEALSSPHTHMHTNIQCVHACVWCVCVCVCVLCVCVCLCACQVVSCMY